MRDSPMLNNCLLLTTSMLRNLLTVVLLATSAVANKVTFDLGYGQVCEGIYAKSDWGGRIQPQIGLSLDSFGNDKYDPKNPDVSPLEDVKVSYVIFEYKDIGHVGKAYGDQGLKKYICDADAVALAICEESQLGKFLVDANVTNTTVMTAQLVHLGKAHINYTVLRTGYYCVSTFTNAKTKYSGTVNFQNAFGQLSASEIPKLPAYGILTVCYAVTMALYGFQFFKKRNQNQILPLQKYLLAMLGFLTFDTLVVWSYFDLVNQTKNPLSLFIGFYMVFLAVLNSTKMTFSLFLLLLIGLGYGVVVLKLEKKIMFRCKLLAACHFAASMFYLLASYHNASSGSTSASKDINSDGVSGSLWDIVPLIPIAITLTAYYMLILTAIRTTTANLHKQRQVIKLSLYENLFRVIFLSVVLTVGGLVLSSFIFLSFSTTEIIEQHWKGSYFIFDFWPSVVFFGVFLGISWLWRPTETSYMLAVSQQVSTGEVPEGEDGAGAGYQHGHEFEFDDMSLMSHSDEENARDSFELNNQSIPSDNPPKYDQVKRDVEPEVGNTSNTLFELGDDEHDQDEDDQHHQDEDDNRLKKST